MLGLSVLPAVLQFIGFLFLPESPRWLIRSGLTQKARRVLSQIRGNQNIDEEYDSIKNSLDEEESGGGNNWEEDETQQRIFVAPFEGKSVRKIEHNLHKNENNWGGGDAKWHTGAGLCQKRVIK